MAIGPLQIAQSVQQAPGQDPASRAVTGFQQGSDLAMQQQKLQQMKEELALTKDQHTTQNAMLKAKQVADVLTEYGKLAYTDPRDPAAKLRYQAMFNNAKQAGLNIPDINEATRIATFEQRQASVRQKFQEWQKLEPHDQMMAMLGAVTEDPTMKDAPWYDQFEKSLDFAGKMALEEQKGKTEGEVINAKGNFDLQKTKEIVQGQANVAAGNNRTQETVEQMKTRHAKELKDAELQAEKEKQASQQTFQADQNDKNRQTQKEIAAMKKKGGGAAKPSVGSQALDRVFAKDYDQMANGGYAKSEAALSELKALADHLNSGAGSGGVVDKAPKWARDLVGADSASIQDRASGMIRDIMMSSPGYSAKMMDTPAEAEAILNSNYNPKLPPKENGARLTRLYNQYSEMLKQRKAAMDFWETHGQSLNGFKASAGMSTGGIGGLKTDAAATGSARSTFKDDSGSVPKSGPLAKVAPAILQTAKTLLKNGATPDQIKKHGGLTDAQIKQLQRQIKSEGGQ
jgi:hypothetical protein